MKRKNSFFSIFFGLSFIAIELSILLPGLAVHQAFADTWACAQDLNNDGNVTDSGETAFCNATQQGELCPISNADCTATLVNAVCPSGSTLNTTDNECEGPAPIINCPSGYTYSSVLNACTAPGTASYQCTYNGSIYNTSSACTSNCTQTASCNSAGFSGGGTLGGSWSWLCGAVLSSLSFSGSGNKLTITANGVSTDSVTLTLNGATISGSGTITGSCSLFGCWLNSLTLSASGNKLTITGNGNSSNSVALTLSGATISGSGTITSSGGSCSWSCGCVLGSLAISSSGGKLTFTGNGVSTNSVELTLGSGGTCPLPGGSVCSGSPSTCTESYPCNTISSCPAGGSYSSADGECIAQISYQCGPGLTYSSTTGLCQASPTCPSTCTSAGFTGSGTIGDAGSTLNSISFSSSGSELAIAGSYIENGVSYQTQSIIMLPVGTLSGSGAIGDSASILNSISFSTSSNSTLVINGTFIDNGTSYTARTSLIANGVSLSGGGTIGAKGAVLNSVSISTSGSQLVFTGTYSNNGTPSSNSATISASGSSTCTTGTYVPGTGQCNDGDTTCPLGSQYTCMDYNGVMQCSPNSCVDLTTNSGTTTIFNGTTYTNNGGTSSSGNCLGQIYIFTGKGGRCQLPGIEDGFHNCCGSHDTVTSFFGCDQEDAEVGAQSNAGYCHLVGEYCENTWPIIGCVQAAHGYCCFNSILGRIIQEQGRPQLQDFQPKGDWGDPSSPNCRGFTPYEFQNIDFSKIDFSSYFGTIEQNVSGALSNAAGSEQQNITNFYNNTQ